jgi:hypothetical protein
MKPKKKPDKTAAPRAKKWIPLGDYSVMGAMSEWDCTIDIRKEKEGLWSARWKGEEGAKESFGPSTLAALFDDLVGMYYLEDGEDLAKMFTESGNPELMAFAAEWEAGREQS